MIQRIEIPLDNVDITDVWHDNSIRQIRTNPTLFRKEMKV